MLVDDCFSCRNTADPDVPDRERVWRTGHWRVAHATDAALPGWLVLLPVEHVTSLDQLAPDAAAELGGLLRALTEVLIRVTGCVKTYVMLLAEAEGFSHMHFHVVPRSADLSEDLRGPRIFALLGADAQHRVPDAQQDAMARSIRSALAGRTVRVFFDFGHRWPLWESGTHKYAMEPSDYGFSPGLIELLRQWQRAWERVADYEIGQTDVAPSPEERRAETDLRQQALDGIRRELPAGIALRVEI